MDPGAEASGAGEAPSTSTGGSGGGEGEHTTDAAEATPEHPPQPPPPPPPPPPQQDPPSQQLKPPLSRYESQKRRDWNTFLQYLKSHKPPLSLARCSGAHVIEFLKYLDQFGKTKVHAAGCPYFGHPTPPSPCACPLKQAWGSLDALIGRLRAAYEENGGRPESNPFAARAVRIYLREVRESQAKARGIPYEKKKRKRNNSSGGGGGGGESSSTATPATTSTSTTTTTTVTATVAGTSETGEGSGAPPTPPEGSSSS